MNLQLWLCGVMFVRCCVCIVCALLCACVCVFECMCRCVFMCTLCGCGCLCVCKKRGPLRRQYVVNAPKKNCHTRTDTHAFYSGVIAALAGLSSSVDSDKAAVLNATQDGYAPSRVTRPVATAARRLVIADSRRDRWRCDFTLIPR